MRRSNGPLTISKTGSRELATLTNKSDFSQSKSKLLRMCTSLIVNNGIATTANNSNQLTLIVSKRDFERH